MKFNIRMVLLTYVLTTFIGTLPCQGARKNPRLDTKGLSSLKVSEASGSVDEVWIPDQTYGIQVPTQEGGTNPAQPGSTAQGESAPVSPNIVIHIRDAHCIYEAQMHIAELIEDLVKRYQIRLVCLEGAVGKLDPSILVRYTSPLVREEVLQGLMKRGRLTGPEYAAVVLGSPITLYGIEDPDLYEQNVTAFKNLAPYREKSTQVFNLLEHQLQDLEPHVGSQELRDLRTLVQGYEQNEISLSPYGLGLLKFYEKALGPTNSKAFLEGYPNVALFIEKEGLEKGIDFQKVEEERARFLTDAAEKLKGDELNELVSKSLKFRLGQFSTLEYYTYLEGLMNAVYPEEIKGKNFKFSSLSKFIQYEKIYGRIQSKGLFDELDKIRDGLFEKLANSPEEKAFLAYSKAIKVLRRLYRSELTQVELADYLSGKDQFRLDGIIGFLKENSQKYGVRLRDGFRFLDEEKLKGLGPSAEDFYNFADKRNGALAERLFDAMETEKVKVAILVAGGFHTEAIKKALKEKGVAYCVITPNIQGEVAYNPYVEVMTGEKNPLERFLLDFKVKGTQEGGISK